MDDRVDPSIMATVRTDNDRDSSDQSSPARNAWSLPSTKTGTLSFVLAIVAVVLILAINVGLNSAIDNRSGTEASELTLIRGLLVIAFWLSCVGALLGGHRAIRQGDRGGLVWLGTIVGLIGTVLLVAELVIIE